MNVISAGSGAHTATTLSSSLTLPKDKRGATRLEDIEAGYTTHEGAPSVIHSTLVAEGSKFQ